ncbi:hypothetical protein BH09VER1_BH09VER1_36530 [soil metagenome]
MLSRLPFLFALGLFAAFRLVAADGPARELAQDAVGAFQKESDKALTSITFPAESAGIAVPDKAEVYLIQGYIDYDCIRLIWKDHQAVGQRLRMTRSWFYSPKESYAAEEYALAEADFKKAWQAAWLIKGATMKVNVPPVRDPKTGWIRGSGSVSGSVSRSSHEWTYLVQGWSEGKEPDLNFLVHGTSTSDGVQLFSEIQTRAICKVFTDLVPKAGSGGPLELKSWGPFLTSILTENEIHLRHSPTRLDSETSLLVETSLRLLGQIGYVPALPVIRAVEADANEAAKERWPANIWRETTVAALKIEMQEKFDEASAARLIRDFDRRDNANYDFILWLRGEYFQRWPDAYFALLAANLQDPQTREPVLLETIADLRALFPQKAAPLLQSLLNNTSSEVVADAALAILAMEPGNEPSLQALTRLASDPKGPIPPAVHWSAYFGRERALDYLTSEKPAVPPAYRWDVARVQKQLDLPWEDGRMVRHLLDDRWILQKRVVPDEAKIAAYRKVLSGPLNMGSADACEALIELKDKDSAPPISAILKELAAHCNKSLSGQGEPGAKYSWIDKYEIERIDDSLNKMLAAPSESTN